MKAAIETKITTITITMTLAEAEWLKGVMQNPLSDDPNPANEDPIDASHRRAFWESLSELLS